MKNQFLIKFVQVSEEVLRWTGRAMFILLQLIYACCVLGGLHTILEYVHVGIRLHKIGIFVRVNWMPNHSLKCVYIIIILKVYFFKLYLSNSWVVLIFLQTMDDLEAISMENFFFKLWRLNANAFGSLISTISFE